MAETAQYLHVESKDPGIRMSTPTTNDSEGLPLFESDADATYTLDVVAEITGVSSTTILHYKEHGLIVPVVDSGPDAMRFDAEALRRVRRIEHLQAECGVNEPGLKLLLDLLDEVERLREELQSRR